MFYLQNPNWKITKKYTNSTTKCDSVLTSASEIFEHESKSLKGRHKNVASSKNARNCFNVFKAYNLTLVEPVIAWKSLLL